MNSNSEASSETQVVSNGRILVADDDAQIRELISDSLLRSGYEVHIALNGAMAWQLLKNGKYDLLITDHQMPKMTGMELITKLRSENMNLPVILVSGTIPTQELERRPELKIEAVWPKPINIEALLGSVKRVLNKANEGGSDSSDDPTGDVVKVSGEEKLIGAPKPTHPVRRILVVDDNPDMRDLSINILTRSGYDAKGVTDGAAGWAALQSAKYDLVLTDNKMPKMSGLEMIEKLRVANMGVPVIMASGMLPHGLFVRKPWLKPDALLEMPFSNEDLLASVEKLLREDGGGHVPAQK